MRADKPTCAQPTSPLLLPWTTGSVVAQIFELEACHLETESMFHKNEKTYEDCCWMFI